MRQDLIKYRRLKFQHRFSVRAIWHETLLIALSVRTATTRQQSVKHVIIGARRRPTFAEFTIKHTICRVCDACIFASRSKPLPDKK